MPEEKQKSQNQNPSVAASAPKKKMSTGAKVGIGVGIGCCILLIIGLIIGIALGWNIGNMFQKQQTYLIEFQSVSNDTANAFNELTAIQAKYPNFTQADLDTIDANSKTIENAYDRISKLSVPSDYQEINDMYKQGLLYFKEAMPIYRQAVRTKNITQLQQASDLINKGVNEINKAKQKIEEKQNK